LRKKCDFLKKVVDILLSSVIMKANPKRLLVRSSIKGSAKKLDGNKKSSSSRESRVARAEMSPTPNWVKSSD